MCTYGHGAMHNAFRLMAASQVQQFASCSTSLNQKQSAHQPKQWGAFLKELCASIAAFTRLATFRMVALVRSVLALNRAAGTAAGKLRKTLAGTLSTKGT